MELLEVVLMVAKVVLDKEAQSDRGIAADDAA